MSLADAILSIATPETVTVQRKGAGSYGTDGIFNEDDDPTEVEASGQFVPATAKDMLRLPEGRRSEEAIRFFTKTALVVASTDDGTQADTFDREGRTYEVAAVTKYAQGGTFYDAICTRVGR